MKSNQPAVFSRFGALLLRASRPLLRLNLLQYERDVRNAPFPVDPPEYQIEGRDADHVIFVGDVAVMGYGVRWQGMTVCFRAAQAIARQRRRGCAWETIGEPALTAARLANRSRIGEDHIDAAVVSAVERRE